ncbi:E motif [Dillenia turbinata]|uniref:E motif n=1 Tax=Dillenia turbinata TaxID=194707 RepID=A0AAN8VAB0_9MAGN
MLHAHAFVSGFVSNVIVNAALVDGYGKCGLVIDARQLLGNSNINDQFRFGCGNRVVQKDECGVWYGAPLVHFMVHPIWLEKWGRGCLNLTSRFDSAYVIAGNVFAGKGRWDEVAKVRNMMKERRVRKEGGRSWVEERVMIHVFFAGDGSHERTKEIYANLAELMEKIEELGYVPVWNEVLHEVEER